MLDGKLETVEQEQTIEEFMGLGFYELLGVEPGVTGRTLTKAFQQLARKHHPDKGGVPFKFVWLQAIYEILKNPTKRNVYDTQGRAGCPRWLPKALSGGPGPSPGPPAAMA